MKRQVSNKVNGSGCAEKWEELCGKTLKICRTKKWSDSSAYFALHDWKLEDDSVR